ncbi:MAG: aspartate aminotransferase family protein [Acidobacteria bacterium]|nr:aspartate aminotransferase family protein [Acidobacteriota bacterium]
MTQALFPRSFRKTYPLAVRGEGCYVFTADGKKYLDAAGGAAVVSIGHGVAAIGRAMAEQAARLAFTHTSQFHTEAAERLAQRLRRLAPPSYREAGRVYFTSGGSEATETAIKLARQYFVEHSEPSRIRIVSRWQSYHGSTLGALAVSGNLRRRAPYTALLPDWGHIPPCYCYRCPLGLTYPDCQVACADELEKFVESVGPETVAAFIFEPVVGATLGAAVPPEGYVQRLAEICRRYAILLIADEVMTGMGRTGTPFAVEHWGIAPDMMLVGKGVASGYAPLGGVLVAPHVAETIARGSGAFEHGFTYQAHPVAMAAGLAVLDYIEEHRLFERVAPAGCDLLRTLEPLSQHPHVGDIRARGLLLGVELVKDRATREPFPREAGVAEAVRRAALDEGVTTYPIQGCADGERGDHILLAPPFIISPDEIRETSRALTAAIARAVP